MKSLFNSAENRELIQRIEKLTEVTKPLWGSMNSTTMLTHCTVSLKMAFGEIVPEHNETFLRIGRMVRDRLFDTDVFNKNLATTKEFLVGDNGKFDDNKILLIAYIKRFGGVNPDSSDKAPHPYFGELSMKEWDSLIYKHLNHHLLQFGV
ncbi:MAG: DUF1569 domain-containing protein [Bacteroidetes bacterium]|nr:DUF1569 domain-containing protein [Bacteroidota bacterium]